MSYSEILNDYILEIFTQKLYSDYENGNRHDLRE